MQKRYVLVMVVVVIVGVLIWKLSGSYALYNQGFTGNNYVTGNKWSINIVNVEEITLEGDATLIKEVSTIGTTLGFEVSLPKSNSLVKFTFEVENMGELDAELYALTLTGLSSIQSEYIDYEIIPLDYVTIKTHEQEGSILKKNEKHLFQITVKYQDNVNENNVSENILNLGSTIIYEQK